MPLVFSFERGARRKILMGSGVELSRHDPEGWRCFSGEQTPDVVAFHHLVLQKEPDDRIERFSVIAQQT